MPPAFQFTLDNEAFDAALSLHHTNLHKPTSPLATAWCRVAWECVLAEVAKRYGSQDKVVFRRKATAAGQEQECLWTMRQLCERLHIKPATAEEQVAWLSELCALHWHLHEKVDERAKCPVCGEHGGGHKLRKSSRWTTAQWTLPARQTLWQASQDTIRRCDCAWSIWRPVALGAPSPVSLPPKLQQECVPFDKIVALPEGLCPRANTASLFRG